MNKQTQQELEAKAKEMADKAKDYVTIFGGGGMQLDLTKAVKDGKIQENFSSDQDNPSHASNG
jgi:hypothetical protein